MSNVFIHAVNIHQGGGAVLLRELLDVWPSGTGVTLTLDARLFLSDELQSRFNIRYIKPTIFQRLLAEVWLLRNVDSQSRVVCFGNLPPLFKLSGKVAVFVQNRYLVDDFPISKFSLFTRVKLTLERYWLRVCHGNADQYIVQTPTMKALLQNKVNPTSPVYIFPFVSEAMIYAKSRTQKPSIAHLSADFVYVASGEPHKNHLPLIAAWKSLAQKGLYPSLILTVNPLLFPDLSAHIQRAVNDFSLEVVNVGEISLSDVKEAYSNVRALIYPSLFESFGLPLLEAKCAGLPILAPELDFVRDVVDPDFTFDPTSHISIERAVMRFLGIHEISLRLRDAAEFAEWCILGGSDAHIGG